MDQMVSWKLPKTVSVPYWEATMCEGEYMVVLSGFLE